MISHEIREKYLDFFQKHGHVALPSASLLPENDPTTLFTGSGMQPMISFLLGASHPLGRRFTNSQKCFRSVDIEEIGDNRHLTFFEMLGNWSLGDYFKKEQIPWIFTFLTKELGLNPERLFVTVFRGKNKYHLARDEESSALWQEVFAQAGITAKIADFPEEHGMQGARIFYYDERKNWWSRAGVPENMPMGEPGGPDTEMFWDFGEERGLHEKWIESAPERFYGTREEREKQICHVNCDCGRFIEIGNSVFMQYQRTRTGFEPLPQKNVDFGGGLERLTMAVNDQPDIFLIDSFASMLNILEHVSGKNYANVDAVSRGAFRVIMDHLRAATFLLADGALPSNKDQGYFTRRLIRRAVRYAWKLDIQKPFCAEMVKAVIETYQIAYPRIKASSESILTALQQEEIKFSQTLKMGLKRFTTYLDAAKIHNRLLSGKDTFDLYQNYGFPIELSEELALEHGITVDKNGFEAEMLQHQTHSREGASQKFEGGLADHSKECVQYHTATHLLHQALRQILGVQVEQKGSNITKERMRFDFLYPQKLSSRELSDVSDLVNKQIQRALPISWEILSVEEAKQQGAIGLFGEKYDKQIKVYTVGDFSKEICGGPHVNNTTELGHFRILKEEACSLGVRRIKAILE